MTEAMTTTATITDGQVVAWFETVGPARATQLLATYKVDYRKFRPSYAAGLARDMASGKWIPDGSPIRIDVEGNLFDGQHRLKSIELSGTAQNFLILSGLPVEAYDTTDTGLARTYGDTLRRRGFQNVSQRQALQKLIHRWENGLSLDDTKRLTHPEMDEILYRYVDRINHAVGKAMSMNRKMCMPSALVTFSWWILADISMEDAHTFLVGVAEGENLRSGMPAYTLRERLRNDLEFGHTRNEYMHLVFSAWNAFREDRKIAKLQLPSGFVTRDKVVNPK